MVTHKQPKRIKLISTSDPFTHVKPGDLGWEVGRDDLGTLYCDWDNGSNLGLIPGEDEWEYISEKST